MSATACALLLAAAPSALAHGAPKKAALKADAPSEWYMRPEVLAVGATALISIAPMTVLPLLPEATGAGMTSQPLLLCFAAGGMLGDVFLHTLPETLGPMDVLDSALKLMRMEASLADEGLPAIADKLIVALGKATWLCVVRVLRKCP